VGEAIENGMAEVEERQEFRALFEGLWEVEGGDSLRSRFRFVDVRVDEVEALAPFFTKTC
jgi:hypothetical protein